MNPIATVGVLLYGDHPQLAARCLGPLWPLHRAGLISLRVGLNECGAATRAYVARETATAAEASLVVHDRNVHKYPMMRQLMAVDPLLPHFMWFDDDSYVDPRFDAAEVVRRAVALCEPNTMVGQLWRMPLGGNQHLWVRHQPWYAGQEVLPGRQVKFCQGAWWVAESAFLLKHDWPVPELERKGGDVMLGELCRQQGVRLRDVGREFGVRINADEHGAHSRSKTRGPLPLPRPVGWDFRPPDREAPRHE